MTQTDRERRCSPMSSQPSFDRLAAAFIRVSADDFHHMRAIRYRRGRGSPEGFWLDSYDYDRLRADVLDPLGPGGSRRHRRAAHDLRTDAILDSPWLIAPPGSVLVLDGLFLHRDELPVWAFSVFLDVHRYRATDGAARRNECGPESSEPAPLRRGPTDLLPGLRPSGPSNPCDRQLRPRRAAPRRNLSFQGPRSPV